MPEPQSVRLGAEDFRFGSDWRIELGPGVAPGNVAVPTLMDDIESRFHVRVGGVGAGGGALRLTIAPGSVAAGAAQDRDKNARRRFAAARGPHRGLARSALRQIYWDAIYEKRRPARDQGIPLPPAPGADLSYGSDWAQGNARRLQLAEDSMAENEELIGLLYENLRKWR